MEHVTDEHFSGFVFRRRQTGLLSLARPQVSGVDVLVVPEEEQEAQVGDRCVIRRGVLYELGAGDTAGRILCRRSSQAGPYFGGVIIGI
jgi:hypothetical protein